MSIATIRAALVTVLTGVSGINEVQPYPPDAVAVAGTAWIGLDSDEVVYGGGRELHIHTLPVTVVVSRKSQFGKEVAATEPVIDAFLAAIRGNVTLGGAVDRCAVATIQQGVVTVGQVEYVGFTATLDIKAHVNAVLTP